MQMFVADSLQRPNGRTQQFRAGYMTFCTTHTVLNSRTGPGSKIYNNSSCFVSLLQVKRMKPAKIHMAEMAQSTEKHSCIKQKLLKHDCIPIVFQIPAEKVFWVGFLGPNTSSQGIWKPGCNLLQFSRVTLSHCHER